MGTHWEPSAGLSIRQLVGQWRQELMVAHSSTTACPASCWLWKWSWPMARLPPSQSQPTPISGRPCRFVSLSRHLMPHATFCLTSLCWQTITPVRSECYAQKATFNQIFDARTSLWSSSGLELVWSSRVWRLASLQACSGKQKGKGTESPRWQPCSMHPALDDSRQSG